MKHLQKSMFIIVFFSFLPHIFVAETPNRTPEPYGIDEFATWQKDLRRFEILSFGALPFVSLFSFWGYDMIRSSQHRGDPAYYPWPLKRADIAAPLTEKEQKNVFFTAMGLSVGVALIDYIVRAVRRAKNNKNLQEEAALRGGTIELIPLEDDMIDENGMLKEDDGE